MPFLLSKIGKKERYGRSSFSEEKEAKRLCL
jgi:hypothetical protein